MAEKLQESGEFKVVITPLQVEKILEKLDIGRSISRMTRKEMLEVFGKVCRKEKADSILALRYAGSKTNLNEYSFKKANTEFFSEVYIYDYRENRLIYDSVMKITVEMTDKPVSEEEVVRITGEAVAEKIIQLKQGKTPAGQAGTPDHQKGKDPSGEGQ